MLAYAIFVLKAGEAHIDARAQMILLGKNLIAFSTVILSAAIFLHCHYFWGNVYNQVWFAVLGKIISACGFIAGLVFLCIHIGILGRN